ncbi:acetyltransferase [Aquisalimonas sp. 2447]|uniref:NeuD/PglB/VioB family sugar acetyltransferase n=1 Tax=Aquisalimonas sp. 2447 TaxID=2740807 RepID=UPI0014327D08|nr:NeuD/PglB/VioB family sugar acetyltransferase [Aquisalimonas sp. 2447]QIT55909.1 acetyltransferase [Aquisalimonas sp. 2447]
MPESDSKLLIVGAGGFGRTVAETVLAQGHYELVGFLDDGKPAGETVFGVPVLGDTGELGRGTLPAASAVVAIGNNVVRARLCEALRARGARLINVIHERACVSPSALLGEGVVIMGGAVLGTEARLGHGVIVNSGATVDHHAVVDDFGHIGAGSALAGGARVGARAWLRAGCVLGYGSDVEADQILPPGTVLGE